MKLTTLTAGAFALALGVSPALAQWVDEHHERGERGEHREGGDWREGREGWGGGFWPIPRIIVPPRHCWWTRDEDGEPLQVCRR